MDAPKRHMITSALPYANGPLHIGHVAGAYLPADNYVRYLRLRGRDVAFICGSDEHGAAITIRAKKDGKQPKEIVDQFHKIIEKAFVDLQISFDFYHRTSSELHHETAAAYFKELYDKGVFDEKETEQFYDPEFKQFLADRYIVGTCPKCGNENAYGDQCENCGRTLNPTDLLNPRSTLSNKTPELKKTRHWYLPLDKDQEWLKEWIEQGTLDGKPHHDPKTWKKNVTGQCLSWLNDGLQARAITRDLDWGVKVPLPGAEGKVLYVWLDAPIGYISATKQWAANTGKDWKQYWQDEDSEVIHFIGKDNIVFHCIIFPALLKAHGGYNLPVNVPANEFMNLEGDKISTSRNWAIWVHEYIEEFPDKVDVLRYVLCSNSPETKDSEFTWSDYQARNNNELVAILGNYVNRVVVLTHKYFEGKCLKDIDDFQAADHRIDQLDLTFSPDGFAQKIADSIEQFRFREAQGFVMDIARAGNKYLTDREPWKLFKTDPEQVAEILAINLQVIANLAIALEPFLPVTSRKILKQLNLDEETLKWKNLGRLDLLPKDHSIAPASLLFEIIDDEVVLKQVAKLKSSRMQEEEKQENTVAEAVPVKPEISFDDFTKMDMRIGTIKTAEKVEKADKLLKLSVDVGFETRTVVSGIAEHFNPEEIIGKQVTLLINLAPRKIRGVESQGMILMAEDATGSLKFIAPSEQTENGSGVS